MSDSTACALREKKGDTADSAHCLSLSPIQSVLVNLETTLPENRNFSNVFSGKALRKHHEFFYFRESALKTATKMYENVFS